jgi:putative FmdB family regulatory protein
MPIYEYSCPRCGVFEIAGRIKESALKKCPTCNSKVERLVSRTSFVLKGSGWYATDYPRVNGAAKPESDKSESTTAAKGATGEASPASPSPSDSSSKGSSGADKSPSKSAN